MDNKVKSQMMEKNSKRRKDALNGSASSRSSRGSTARESDVPSRASDNTGRASSSSFSSVSTLESQPGMTYNSSMVAPSGEIISGYDLRAHLRQIMRDISDEDQSSDDYSVESYDENEGDEELQRLAGQGHNVTDSHVAASKNKIVNSQALVPVDDSDDDGDDGADLDSEDENALMLEIKNEIRNNVRQEMKSELDLYQAKLETLERKSEKPEGERADPFAADLDHLEPKMRDAFIKMRKLDKILVKRVRREKEVKKDRILLERRMRREIEQLHSENKSEYKEVTANEHKYLSLELPPSHNEETDISTETLHSIQTDSLSSIRQLSSLVTSPEHGFQPVDNQRAVSPLKSSQPSPNTPLFPHTHSSPMSVTAHELFTENVTVTPDTNDQIWSPLYHQFTPVPPSPLTECLGLSSSTEQGVVLPPEEFLNDPVFTTQLNEDEYTGIGRKISGAGDGATSRKGNSRTSSKQSSECGTEQSADTTHNNANDEGRKHKRKKNKDFIKRNKELAADAENMIAMTEEEKTRVKDLLNDIDNIAELPEDDSNPYQVAVPPGEGFHPVADDLQSLVSIDARLKEILPEEEFQSISSTSVSNVPQHKLFTHTGVKSDIDWQNRGERALFENAEHRDMKDRLLAIEEELAKLHNPQEVEPKTNNEELAKLYNPQEVEFDTPRLDNDQLHDLLDQCVTSLSRTSSSRMTLTESRSSFNDTVNDTDSLLGISDISENVTVDNTPRSPRSACQEVWDHPPRLDPVVLQQLLSEAYNPLSKQLSTLREEDEDEEATPIPADVWKLISEQNVDDSPALTTERLLADSRQKVENAKNSDQNRPQSGHVGDQQMNSDRNGYMTLSRDSTSSSLSSITDTGRESVPLKLPEIDPSGTLVTQGLNNWFPGNQRSGSSNSSRTPIHMVRNSFSDSKIDNRDLDSQLEMLSLSSEMMSPQPPSGEKRDRGAKSRTVTPTNRPMT